MIIDLKTEEGDEIQLAPLIDCVFLLLIFFLVATTLKKIDQVLPLELPESAAAIQTQTADDMLVLGVDRAGQIYLGDRPVELGVLHDELRRVANVNPDHPIRIDADKNVAFKHVVHLMDLCAFEGLNDVAVHTKQHK